MDSVDGAHTTARVSEATHLSKPDDHLQILGNEVRPPAIVSAQEGRNGGVKPPHTSSSSLLLELKVPQLTTHAVTVTRELSGELLGIKYSRSTTFRELYCCRSAEERTSAAGFEFQSPMLSFSRREENSHRGFPKDYKPGSVYIVVGIKGSNLNIPKERLMFVTQRNDNNDGYDAEDDGRLFKAIEKGARSVRPHYRELLSLKSISGFGIYQCFPVEGYHDTVEVGPKTTKTLALLFNDYTSKKRRGINRQWIDWIHDEFNCNSDVPEQGKYALELVLRWSATKFIVWGLSPVLLSLVIGFWYMLKPLKDSEDPVAVVQTAWTISSYIVTAAAGKCMLLGIITLLQLTVKQFSSES